MKGNDNLSFQYLVPKMVWTKFTVMAWYNPGPYQPLPSAEVLVSTERYPGDSCGFSITYRWTLPYSFTMGLGFDDSNWVGLTSPPNTLEDDEWTYIGGTYNYNGDTGKKKTFNLIGNVIQKILQKRC